jgi:hypothetical protein
VVEGCERPADGSEAVFNEATVRLCQEHHADFDVDPLEWDGELDDSGSTVVRLWKREGIGQAS